MSQSKRISKTVFTTADFNEACRFLNLSRAKEGATANMPLHPDADGNYTVTVEYHNTTSETALTPEWWQTAVNLFNRVSVNGVRGIKLTPALG